MCTVADLERTALSPPEHNNTEHPLCDECGCSFTDENFCSYCGDELLTEEITIEVGGETNASD